MDEYYWKPEDFEKANRAKNLRELFDIAMAILNRMPQPVILVSGPITTGGRGSIPENLRVFAETIRSVRSSGKTVYNQLPFEDKISELARKSSVPYFQAVLDEVYLPLLKSGKIAKIYFMPGWETSTGAKWEYSVAETLGIERVIMNQNIMIRT